MKAPRPARRRHATPTSRHDPTDWGSVADRLLLGGGLLLLALGLLLLILGCDHDPVILDRHPLDGQYATGRASQSLYLEMDDGVRIAVDIHRPTGYPGEQSFPTILEMTRYWRDRGEGLNYLVRRAVDRGFVYVIVDERGTGASFGRWDSPLSARALEDARQVMDWIVQQSWSNGRIGSTGVSYPGMAAQRIAALGHPALRAIVPMSDSYDLYENLIFPGGMFNEGFLQGWSDVVYALDRSRELAVDGGVFRLQPVDEDPEGVLLTEAIAGHANNLQVFPALEQVTSRDEPFVPGVTLDDVSASSHGAAQPLHGVAVYQWGSWMDAGSADGVIRQFMETPGPRRAVIGAWTHDLWESSDPFGSRGRDASPTGEYQWEEALNFFDDVLRKEEAPTDRTLRYYTMGEAVWKATDRWPIPGTETLRLYLAEDGLLSPGAPADTIGEDVYQVDFNARSANEPRWLGPLFGSTWYGLRTEEDRKLLVYETRPLEEDLEVTGYPIVNLSLSSSHTDGAVLVYLEDVGEQSRSRYVTEGVLRLIHRRVSEDPSPWQRPTPFHSFLSRDAEPLLPGEATDVALGLQPTSALFRAGHRIRIAIAGHDAAAFRRIPAESAPTLRVQRNALHPSWIELPVVRR